MNYRIIKHCWQGAYITDDMNYFTIEQKKVNIISIIKKLIRINNYWYEWYSVKDKKEPIRFNSYQDAYHCLLRLMSGDSVGNWQETIVL